MCQKIIRNNRNAPDSAADVKMAAINTNTPASVPNFSSEDKFPKSKRKLQKHLRSAGLAYVSRTGKLIPAKKIADELCQCPHKCDDLVPTEARHRLFQHFYGLGEADAQNQFLRQNMDLRARLNVPETSANGRPPRRITCKYLVPLLDEERSVEVCQKAFVSAFVITTKRVRLQREKLISSLGLSSYKSHNRSKDKDKKPQETNNNIITLATLTEEMKKAANNNNNNNNSKIANNNNNNTITNNNNNNAKKNNYSIIRNLPDSININSVTITKQPKVAASTTTTTTTNNNNNQTNQVPVQDVPLNLSANLNLTSHLSLILQNINGHRSVSVKTESVSLKRESVSVKRESPEVTVTAEVIGGEKRAEKSPPRSMESPSTSTSTSTETKPPPRKRSKKIQFNQFMPYNLMMPDGVSIAPVVNPDFDRDLMIVNNFFHYQLWKPEYIGAHS